MPSNQFKGNPRGSNRAALILEVVKRGKPIPAGDSELTWYYTINFTLQGCTVEVRWYTGECNQTGEDLLQLSYNYFKGRRQTISGNEGGCYFLKLIKAIKEVK